MTYGVELSFSFFFSFLNFKSDLAARSTINGWDWDQINGSILNRELFELDSPFS